MNTRERMMAGGVLGLLVLVAAVFLFHQLFYAPLRQRDANIEAMRQDIQAKREQIAQARADLPRLERWRQLSLPADVDLSHREYGKYLSELLRQSGFEADVRTKAPDTRNSPMLPGKKPIYTEMTFTVSGHASLENLVTLLDRFYHTGLLHQIKNLSIQRPLTPASPQRPNDLDINLTVEALIINGVHQRPYLLPNLDRRLMVIDVAAALRGGPTGLGLMAWAAGPTGPLGPGTLAQPPRNYAAIASKNIFLGAAPPKEQVTNEFEGSQFVYLTDITEVNRKYQAWLYQRTNQKKQRLRESPGFDSFRVTDDKDNPLVQGKVVRIDARDLIFKANDRYYRMHVGQNVAEAMRKSYPQLEAVTKEMAAR